jgi:hypothetical protein
VSQRKARNSLASSLGENNYANHVICRHWIVYHPCPQAFFESDKKCEPLFLMTVGTERLR